LIMMFNLFVLARRGQRAGANPWRSRGLEWQVPSPMPEMTYPATPVVVGEPYDYGKPGSIYVQFAPAAPALHTGASITGGD